jgi:hypothetical protein
MFRPHGFVVLDLDGTRWVSQFSLVDVLTNLAQQALDAEQVHDAFLLGQLAMTIANLDDLDLR